MKTLIVTSQVTYMPENYKQTLEQILALSKDTLAGLVILKNLDFKTLKSGSGLFFCGAKQTGATMFRNIVELPLKRREKLFYEAGLPVLYESTMNSSRMVDYIKKNQIDLIINMRTRCIYKKKILNAPRFGCLNVHHGLLPTYRGTLCDLYALYEGRDAGFSIHQMTPKLDDGKILKVQKVSRGDKNYQDYLGKTAFHEARALVEVIDHIKNYGALPQAVDNDESQSFYVKTPGPQEIKNFVRGGMVL